MYWIKQFPYLQRFLLINLSLSADKLEFISRIKCRIQWRKILEST